MNVNPLLLFLVGLSALFFFGMGCLGLFWPKAIPALWGEAKTTAAHRTEIRAVYGGFGVFVAAMLVGTLVRPDLVERGVLLALGVSVAGMAAGRLLGGVVERERNVYPTWLLFLTELLLTGALLGAWSLSA